MNATNTYNETHGLIRSLFYEAWIAGPYADLAIAWPNMEFDPDPKQSWVRVAINDGDAYQAALGPHGFHRYLGIVSIQIFTPNNRGDDEPHSIADFISDIFKKIKYPHLRFYTPTMRDASDSQAESYQINVAIEFQRDSIGDRT